MKAKAKTAAGSSKLPTTIDGYLARVKPEQRAALEKLRKDILKAAPKAEECISYQMPGFRLDGRMVCWFAAATKHCAFYPGVVVQDFKEDLEDFATSRGTIRFQPDKPLPVSLVRKLVKAHIALNESLELKKKEKSRAARRKK
jgi:uncharacterized protein YdhG (YjbR/CyaY superfamily)